MVKAIRIHETGGPEVMRWEDVEVGKPEPGEVRLRHTAVRRNRLRRRLREIGRRQVLPVLREPTDVAVRARPSAYGAGFETLRREVVGSVCRSRPDSASS